MPNNLLVNPCGAVSAEDTVMSLARGYVKNTSCVFDYELLLDKQRKWKQEQEQLHNVK